MPLPSSPCIPRLCDMNRWIKGKVCVYVCCLYLSAWKSFPVLVQSLTTANQCRILSVFNFQSQSDTECPSHSNDVKVIRRGEVNPKGLHIWGFRSPAIPSWHFRLWKWTKMQIYKYVFKIIFRGFTPGPPLPDWRRIHWPNTSRGPQLRFLDKILQKSPRVHRHATEPK